MNELKNKYKYFAMIPNYVSDNSTAVELSLYIQIKRRSGEKGICTASEKLFKDRLKIGGKALKKALYSLIDKKLIIFVGKKTVITSGGAQKVNIYKVSDIWDYNIQFYDKGVSKREPLETARYAQKDKKECSFEQQRIPIEEERDIPQEEKDKIKKRKSEISAIIKSIKNR